MGMPPDRGLAGGHLLRGKTTAADSRVGPGWRCGVPGPTGLVGGSSLPLYVYSPVGLMLGYIPFTSGELAGMRCLCYPVPYGPVGGGPGAARVSRWCPGVVSTTSSHEGRESW